jgi:hypothetical protein
MAVFDPTQRVMSAWFPNLHRTCRENEMLLRGDSLKATYFLWHLAEFFMPASQKDWRIAEVVETMKQSLGVIQTVPNQRPLSTLSSLSMYLHNPVQIFCELLDRGQKTGTFIYKLVTT